MITKLTDAQIAKMQEYRDKWIAIGLSTQPADREMAERGIQLCYEIAGLTGSPRIVWCGSPVGNAVTRAIVQNNPRLADSVVASVGDSVWASVWDSVGDSVWASVRDSVWDSAYGQHDADWLGFYDFFHEIGLTEQTRKLAGLWLVAKSAGWFLPCERICWISERHNLIRRDVVGRLHCDSGPALSYPDGWAIFAWHGIRVPERIITNAKNTRVGDILSEENTEVRRVMRNLYGNERFMRDAGAHEMDVHKQHQARLLALRLPGDPVDIRMVELTCPSTGSKYLERVPPDCSSAMEALSWRFNVAPQGYNPEAET